MILYRTPKGRWAGTQDEARKATRDEGSKPGSWAQVSVPVDKAGLLAFLRSEARTLSNHSSNKGRGLGTPSLPVPATPEEQPSKAPLEGPNNGQRWRVYMKGLFACVVLATTEKEARQRAIEEMEVRRVTAR